MKLSILIPMYNAKDYIGNCIESLLNQNIPEEDYEIIVMDDGSTDNSVAIVSEIAKSHKNIKLHTEPNSGTFTTRNKLLSLAQGDYIYNLDADDYLVKDCLKDLLHLAQTNQLDIIGFDTIETTSLEKVDLTKPISATDLKICSGKQFIENFPHLRHEIWWYFIKKDYLARHNMIFNNNEYNADVMFTLQSLLKADHIGYIPVSLHRYVQTENSLMRSKNFEITSKRLGYIQMMIHNTSELINGLNKENHSEALIDNLKHRRDVFTFFNIVNMIRNRFSLKYIKSRIKEFKETGAYPISDFNLYRYNTLQYRIMVSIVNSESLLYILISIKNLFLKPVK